jgi:hypothetical protein
VKLEPPADGRAVGLDPRRVRPRLSILRAIAPCAEREASVFLFSETLVARLVARAVFAAGERTSVGGTGVMSRGRKPDNGHAG